MSRRLGAEAQSAALLALMVLCVAAHQAFDLLQRPLGFEPESLRLSVLLALGTLVLAATLRLRDLSQPGTGWLARLLAQPERGIRVVLALSAAAGALAAFIAPVWNDESFNIEAARYLIDHGLAAYFVDYGALSDWLSPHHPPLLAMLYGLVFKLGGSYLPIGRLLGLAFFLAAQRLTYQLGRELYDASTGLAAALVLLCFPLVIFEAPTALFDMPFLFFFLAALLLLLRVLRGAGWGAAVLAALAIGLGALTRYNMIFIYPLLLAMPVLLGVPRAWRSGRFWLVLAGPALVASPWIAWLALTDLGRIQFARLSSYLLVAFLPEGGPEYVREALLPVLPLYLGGFMIPPLVFGCYLAARGARSATAAARADRLALWWILSILLLTGLTIPHVRYLLPAFPALALLSARGLLRLQPFGASVLGLALFCSIATVLAYDLLAAFGLTYIFY